MRYTETTGDVQTDYYYDESGNVFGFKRGNSEYYYIRNGQGDIIGILDSSGTQVVSYVYDSWGKLVSISGSQAETIGEANPFRYRGYYYDTETGLYYLQSRYYDPEVGRFLNADGYISGVGDDIRGYNLYSYCFNNPINMSDLSGHWPSLSQIFAGIAVVAVAVAAVAVVVATAGAATPVLAAAGGAAVSSAAATTAATVATGAMIIGGVSATAAAVTSVVENTNYSGPARDQSVYVMRDKTTDEVKYVGRTNDPARRQGEHSRDPKKANLQPLEVKFTGLTEVEARAVEQLLISSYALGNLANARREIASGNVKGFAGKIGNIISIFGGTVEDEFLNLMGR